MTQNAQNAGAAAVVVVNNVAGPPTTMGGTNPAIVIPGVILGEAMTVACAGGNGLSVWTIDPAAGGSLVDPKLLYSRTITGVSIGHTAAFSWDGKVLIFGHEPAGGSEARCQATSAEVDRTLFFIDAATGERYVPVSGNYQSGISVVDFTDPAQATEIAYADPAPLVHPTNPNAIVGGGDWSSHWYDGRIYESDMKRGLIIWNLSDDAVAGAKRLGHLNPQTQETSFPLNGK